MDGEVKSQRSWVKGQRLEARVKKSCSSCESCPKAFPAMPTSSTSARPHALQKLLWPAVALLVVGMFVICFVAGAVVGKGMGEDRASAAWYNATRNALHTMREMDVAAQKEPLSNYIHKLDQRLVVESPKDADLAIVEVTKEFAK
jgi:hypothetical protein